MAGHSNCIHSEVGGIPKIGACFALSSSVALFSDEVEDLNDCAMANEERKTLKWFLNKAPRQVINRICMFLDYSSAITFRNTTPELKAYWAEVEVNKVMKRGKMEIKEWRDYEMGSIVELGGDEELLDRDDTDEPCDEELMERISGPLIYSRCTQVLEYDCSGGYMPKNLHWFTDVTKIHVGRRVGIDADVMTYVPTDLYFMDNLKVLELHSVQFEKFPEFPMSCCVSKFQQLRTISICSNRAIRELPSWICSQKKIKSVTIIDCPGINRTPQSFKTFMDENRIAVKLMEAILDAINFTDIVPAEERAGVERCVMEGRYDRNATGKVELLAEVGIRQHIRNAAERLLKIGQSPNLEEHMNGDLHVYKQLKLLQTVGFMWENT